MSEAKTHHLTSIGQVDTLNITDNKLIIEMVDTL